MSENTQDEFEPVSLNNPDEEAQNTISPLPASAQAIEAEVPGSPPLSEETLPPEAQGEANGGPLGCCLGLMFGLLLSLAIPIFGRLYADQLGQLLQNNYSLLGWLVRILMVALALGFAILFGRVGWRLGKRFYREYEPPVSRASRRRSQKQKVKSEI